MPPHPRYAAAWAAYFADNPDVQASWNHQNGYPPPEQYRHLIADYADDIVPDQEQPEAAPRINPNLPGLRALAFENLVAVAAKALQDAAHDCDGHSCGLSSDAECDAQHPIRASVLHFDQIADVEGSIDEIVRTVLQAVQPNLTTGPCSAGHPVHSADWSGPDASVNGTATDLSRIALQASMPKETSGDSYVVVGYEGFGEHEYTEASRRPFGSILEAILALQNEVGPDQLYEALEYVFSDDLTIYWVNDGLGFSIEKES